ncbi:hypothetical protein [Microvirga pudoricolor]|uniref:hypothetical protein n=1 Tax=Microvirga pudoricolor TaxID=2778729 RepID=UPI00195174E4|nr:hypothetical protein [Microvirga pudoricolor]MBM6596555.1 hypothetical protein [Microvirga pudoricolor]
MDAQSPWTLEAVQSLVALAKEGVPMSIISLKLKRSIVDVRAKLHDLGITAPAEA